MSERSGEEEEGSVGAQAPPAPACGHARVRPNDQRGRRRYATYLFVVNVLGELLNLNSLFYFIY